MTVKTIILCDSRQAPWGHVIVFGEPPVDLARLVLDQFERELKNHLRLLRMARLSEFQGGTIYDAQMIRETSRG